MGVWPGYGLLRQQIPWCLPHSQQVDTGAGDGVIGFIPGIMAPLGYLWFEGLQVDVLAVDIFAQIFEHLLDNLFPIICFQKDFAT